MLPQLRVASPCTADREKMTGDNRVRYCDQCQLNVYNFSAMSSVEIEQLLHKSRDRVCGRLYQRLDGTILTKDCPVGFRTRVRHVSRVAGAALAALMSAVSAAAQTPSEKAWAVQDVAGTAGVKLTIVDPTDAVIPRASIIISDQTGARIVGSVSDNLGSYQALDLKPGSWKIKVYQSGFGQQELSVILQNHEIFQSEVKLQVAIIGEVVELAGPALTPSAHTMPNSIPSNETPPKFSVPSPNPSRNPITRLMRKLHF